MLLAGCVLSVGGNVAASLAPNFEALLVGRVVSGLGASFISFTAVISLIALSPAGRRGRTLGVYQAVLQGSSAIGPLASGAAAAWSRLARGVPGGGARRGLAAGSLLLSRHLTVWSPARPCSKNPPCHRRPRNRRFRHHSTGRSRGPCTPARSRCSSTDRRDLAKHDPALRRPPDRPRRGRHRVGAGNCDGHPFRGRPGRRRAVGQDRSPQGAGRRHGHDDRGASSCSDPSTVSSPSCLSPAC